MEEKSIEAVLQAGMQTAQVASWQQLSRQAGISPPRLLKLRRGLTGHLKLGELQQLSQVLQISLDSLLIQIGVLPASPVPDQQTFQSHSLQIIESFLTYWPAAAYQAQLNPDFPASKLLPLVKPIEKLLATWDVQQIDPVGKSVAFNPQYHQAMTGQIQPGAPVIIRYPGYLHREKLLWRAQVSGS